MLHQLIEPLLTHELSITCEILNLVIAKDVKELIDKLNTLLGI